MLFIKLTLSFIIGIFFFGPNFLAGQAPPPPVDEPVEMWSFPETMPYPAVCDSVETPKQRDCGNELMLGIIYDNLKWPVVSRQNCVEGTAVISFTVTKTGELEDFFIARDLGAGTGEEALRVVKLMAKQTSPWVPGTQGHDKRPVPMRFNMPVKFKLE